MDLHGTNMQGTGSVDPGAVETEFSIVRFKGDTERAKQVYQGMTPLIAEDIAGCGNLCPLGPVNLDLADLFCQTGKVR